MALKSHIVNISGGVIKSWTIVENSGILPGTPNTHSINISGGQIIWIMVELCRGLLFNLDGVVARYNRREPHGHSRGKEKWKTLPPCSLFLAQI